MKNLIESLKKETEAFKVQYLEKVKNWAGVDFERIDKLKTRYNALGSHKEMGAKNYYQAQKFLHRTGYSILASGKEKYQAKQVEQAEKHYLQSLEKLAFRVEKKGLNLEAIKVNFARVDQAGNMEIKLSEAEKIVRAFTIIAEGEIQRPHYRYLVK